MLASQGASRVEIRLARHCTSQKCLLNQCLVRSNRPTVVAQARLASSTRIVFQARTPFTDATTTRWSSTEASKHVPQSHVAYENAREQARTNETHPEVKASFRTSSPRHENDVREAEVKAQAEKEYEKRYDAAARKWVSTIIALPILIVTSYYLFDRLALGNKPKRFNDNSTTRQ